MIIDRQNLVLGLTISSSLLRDRDRVGELTPGVIDYDAGGSLGNWNTIIFMSSVVASCIVNCCIANLHNPGLYRHYWGRPGHRRRNWTVCQDPPRPQSQSPGWRTSRSRRKQTSQHRRKWTETSTSWDVFSRAQYVLGAVKKVVDLLFIDETKWK